MTQLGFIINLDVCMDCRGCQTACKIRQDSPMGVYSTEVFQNTSGEYPNDECYFIAIMCQHCSKPSCLDACKCGNLVKNEQGIVLIVDQEKCAECADKACAAECPYNAIRIDRVSGKAYKCDMCQDLVAEGKRPACVAGCLNQAYFSGDLDDPDSLVSQMIAGYGEEYIHQLKPESGVEPNIYYFLSRKPWRDMDYLYSQNWHE